MRDQPLPHAAQCQLEFRLPQVILRGLISLDQRNIIVSSTVHWTRPGSFVVLAWVVLAATGCASGPPVGGHAWVGISGIVQPSDLSGHTLYSVKLNVDPQRLAAAGLSLDDVAAGRLARVSCSPSIDAWWDSYAVLPPGLAAKPGQVVRIRVQEDSTNERLAINPVVGGIEPGLASSLPAYDLIPDWRERGLRNNYRKIELPEELRGRYRIVQGSYDIAC